MHPADPKAAKAVRFKYNILARLYDRVFLNYIKKTIAAAIEPLHLSGQERLLDIGCGTGELEKILVQTNAHFNITGIDLSEDMLRLAQKKLSSYPNIILKQGDFLTVDLEQDCFDVAFSISNFHYFSNPLAIFQKVQHLLRKGGRFVIIDWDRNSVRGKLYNWYMNLADPAFAKAYTLEEATELLKKSGFTMEITDSFKVGLRWSMMRLVSRKP